MGRLRRDGTVEPVYRNQILRHEWGHGNVHFPCSAGHEQDWKPYPVDPYSDICDDHTHTRAKKAGNVEKHYHRQLRGFESEIHISPKFSAGFASVVITRGRKCPPLSNRYFHFRSMPLITAARGRSLAPNLQSSHLQLSNEGYKSFRSRDGLLWYTYFRAAPHKLLGKKNATDSISFCRK